MAELKPDATAALARRLAEEFYDASFDVEEFHRHREETVDVESRRRVYVKTSEDTLLRKLQWYRLGGEVSDRQWSAVVGIARTQGERLDRAHLGRWAPVLGVVGLLARFLGSE